MAFLLELTEYKNKIMKSILSDKSIMTYVSGEDSLPDSALPMKEMGYTQVFPYDFIPEAAVEQKTYICFDIDVPRIKTPVVSDIRIYFYIFTHNDLLRIPGQGIRTDLICNAIDKVFNGDESYGYGKLELKSVGRISPARGFQGRVMEYVVQDFNRIGNKI